MNVTKMKVRYWKGGHSLIIKILLIFSWRIPSNDQHVKDNPEGLPIFMTLPFTWLRAIPKLVHPLVRWAFSVFRKVTLCVRSVPERVCTKERGKAVIAREAGVGKSTTLAVLFKGAMTQVMNWWLVESFSPFCCFNGRRKTHQWLRLFLTWRVAGWEVHRVVYNKV